MKKAILIIVFGLLVSITTYASEATLKRALEELIPVGSPKKHLCRVTGGLKMHKKRNTFIRKSLDWCAEWHLKTDPKGDYIYFPEYKNSFIYYPKYKTEIVHHSHAKYETDDAKLVHFVYENVNKPMKCRWMVCTKGDGTLKKIAYSRDEALAIADPEYAKVYEEKKKKEAEEAKRLAEERKKEAKKREEEAKKKKEERLAKKKKEAEERARKEAAKPKPGDILAVASGTGFFINKSGNIISNNHVIDSCTTVKVHYKGGAKAVKILAIDRVNDLSLMKSEVNPDDVFAISKEDAELMEDIWVAGYPFGKVVSSSVKINKGNVNALTGIGDNYSNFQTDAPMQPGNSGGPIINQKGNVVGVAVAKLDYKKIIEDWGAIPEGTNFGIKSSTVQQFIKANGVSSASVNLVDMSNTELGTKIQKATVYLDCWMTVQQIEQAKSRKVIFTGIK